MFKKQNNEINKLKFENKTLKHIQTLLHSLNLIIKEVTEVTENGIHKNPIR